MKVIRCDCGFEASDDGDDQLVSRAQHHARDVPGMDLPADLVLALVRPRQERGRFMTVPVRILKQTEGAGMSRWVIAFRSWAAVLLAATAAVSCAGSGNDGARPSTSAAEQPRQGGTIVVAIGEPVRADWYGQCGASNFGVLALQTLPVPLRLVDDEYQVSDLLTGEPMVDPGPPQRVTYRINPAAVWSDGTPITSADFKPRGSRADPTTSEAWETLPGSMTPTPRRPSSRGENPRPTGATGSVRSSPSTFSMERTATRR